MVLKNLIEKTIFSNKALNSNKTDKNKFETQ